MRNALVATLIVLGLLGTTAAAAKDARVVVDAEGESFGAIPKFRLWADARLVGEAQLGRSPGTSGAETTDENLVHYGGRFEFIVRNVQNVKFLGIGFANDTDSSSGKPGVRSLTITGISVDGVAFDPGALTRSEDAGATVGRKSGVLRQEGLFRLKRPAGGWAQRTPRETPAETQARKLEARKKEAARLAAAEEETKKAESARLTAAEDKREGRKWRSSRPLKNKPRGSGPPKRNANGWKRHASRPLKKSARGWRQHELAGRRRRAQEGRNGTTCGRRGQTEKG